MVGRLIRGGLVVLAIVIAGSWLMRRTSFREKADLPGRLVKADSLGEGDLRVVSTDSGVSVALQGDRILAGLSPKTIARVRAGLDSSATKDTSGLGGSIAQMVKKTVSENINAQMAYPLSEIRDVSYDNGLIVLHAHDGKTHRLFENSKVSGDRPRFASEDAERFIAAFRARKAGAP